MMTMVRRVNEVLLGWGAVCLIPVLGVMLLTSGVAVAGGEKPTAEEVKKILAGTKDLSGVDFTVLVKDLNRTKFTGANLRGAKFDGLTIDYSDFRGADLSGASLRGASLDDSDFTGAILHNSDLSNAHLCPITLTRADLRNADLSGVSVFHGDASGANLEGVNFEGATLSNLNLAGANVSGANFRNVEFAGSTSLDNALNKDKVVGLE